MNFNPIQKWLDKQQTILLDGALATELEARGADLKDPLWSARILLEAPELIRQVHYDYFVAGADIAISASYQATFQGFAQRGLDQEQATDLMELSVQLACQARDEFWADHQNRLGREYPLVAASIGPYGAYLADGSEYRGDYGITTEVLMDFHRPRMAVLANSGPDLLACETIPCQQEAEALIQLLGEFPHHVAWLSFSCCDETHVCHGEPFTDCVALANSSPQIIAVGLNCTPPAYAECLLSQASQVTTMPLLAYPNSGETWLFEDHCWESNPDDDVSMQARFMAWHRAGARLIGGCCRTTPETIAVLQVARRLTL